MAGELDADGPATVGGTPTGLMLAPAVESGQRGFGEVVDGAVGEIIDYVPAASLRRRRPVWMLIGMVVGIGVGAGAALVLTLQQPAVRERLPASLALPGGQPSPAQAAPSSEPVPVAAPVPTGHASARPRSAATAAPSAGPTAPAATPTPVPSPSPSDTPTPGPSITPIPNPTIVPVGGTPMPIYPPPPTAPATT